MLQAAVAMVSRTGLTVSLEHISFEDVIRDAGVSRSAVYRRWPYKDLFFSDLVKELAQKATPTIVSEELSLIKRVAAERMDWLETPELRQRLVVELLRRLSVLDFQTLYGSPEWLTYLALHATFLSIADEDLRDQVQAALAQSEHDHIARVASAWERLTGLIGYRLRPELGATFETAATLVDSAMRGLVITALSVPELATYRAPARPLGAASTDEWSLPGLALASIALAFLEPDPAVEWDAERIARVRRAMADLETPEV
jgi:AcrR family transcriptional regulator